MLRFFRELVDLHPLLVLDLRADDQRVVSKIIIHVDVSDDRAIIAVRFLGVSLEIQNVDQLRFVVIHKRNIVESIPCNVRFVVGSHSCVSTLSAHPKHDRADIVIPGNLVEKHVVQQLA